MRTTFADGEHSLQPRPEERLREQPDHRLVVQTGRNYAQRQSRRRLLDYDHRRRHRSTRRLQRYTPTMSQKRALVTLVFE